MGDPPLPESYANTTTLTLPALKSSSLPIQVIRLVFSTLAACIVGVFFDSVFISIFDMKITRLVLF